MSGGHKTQANLIRPVAKLEQLSYYNELLNRVKELRKKIHTFKNIADKLNQEGWLPPKRQKVFTSNMVGTLLRRAGIHMEDKPRSSQVKRHQHEWTFRELSQKLNILEPTLICMDAEKYTDGASSGGGTL